MYYLHLTFYFEIIDSEESRVSLAVQMKESACTAGDPSSVPGSGRRREWQLNPVFLPREFHGQRNLAGYSPWDRRVRHDRVTIILRGICKEIFL